MSNRNSNTSSRSSRKTSSTGNFTTISSLPTSKERLVALMRSRAWRDTPTLRDIVGVRYRAAMSELRKSGYKFEKTFTQKGTSRIYSYRLISTSSSTGSSGR